MIKELVDHFQFRRIVKNLYNVVDGAYYPAMMIGGRHINVPAFKAASYQFDFHWPLQELSQGKKSDKASGLKAFFDAIFAEDKDPKIQAAITEANNTAGFWGWVAKQTPELATDQAAGGRGRR